MKTPADIDCISLFGIQIPRDPWHVWKKKGNNVDNMLPRLCVHFRLGLSDYEKVWKYQKALVEEICLHRSLDQNESHGRSCDFLITCTHSDTYTLGRGGLVENISSSCLSYGRVVRVERGGDVTWHGPGQMVAYPIIDLTKHKKDLHWYDFQLVKKLYRLILSHEC